MPTVPPTTGPALRRAAFDLLVLDIAGTTIEEHNAVYAALEQAVRTVGADPGAADLQRWMGADKTEAITGLLTDRTGAAPGPTEVAAVYRDFGDRLAAAYRDRPPTPLPGVGAALAGLRAAGLQVALTTGFSRDVTDALLASVGWTVGAPDATGGDAARGDATGGDATVVDAVVCAEEVGAGRPAPYMIFEAMRRTGVHDVGRVLVAGDTTLDLLAGHHAGAGAVVGVLTGAMDAGLLGRGPLTHLLAGVADLPTLLAP